MAAGVSDRLWSMEDVVVQPVAGLGTSQADAPPNARKLMLAAELPSNSGALITGRGDRY